jgi:putative hydrolase of HD superfamily
MADVQLMQGPRHDVIDPQIGLDMDFVMLLDRLKDIERQNPLTSSDRRERVAEHSWHLAVAAILLGGYASEDIDFAKAAVFAIVHDAVEIWSGDTFAFGSGVADQYDREHAAMKLLESDPSPAGRRLLELWMEYERQDTAEARFVKGLDAVLPIAHNRRKLEDSSWARHGVGRDQVAARLDRHGDPGRLRPYAEQMIDEAAAEGVLK